MTGMLEGKTRYLQIAFNYDARMVRRVLPTISPSGRILIEAGTPYIKREGMDGIRLIRRYWRGHVVADIKTVDGALGEVDMVHAAGASAATVLGNSPTETLDLFIERCSRLGMISMIDMLGVKDPLKVMMRLTTPPDVMVLHVGRDEENTRGKLIQYRHVTRVKSKFDVLISAAGGVGVKEARSAIFNGANIVVANLVSPGDPWTGISTDGDVAKMAKEFLTTIE
ncbi:MAG: orotidine 5'-phosphate decarboxylase / HUMPS family protein [Anaerolineales bacterium]|jgi:bifunctional enzyme Fae/Hps